MSQVEHEDPFVTSLRGRLDTAYREADRILVTVSSGVLALSVAFVSNSTMPMCALQLIQYAWGLFIMTIIAVLVSLFVEQRDKVDLIKAGGREAKRTKIFGRWQAWLNGLALATFLLGCVSLFLFLISNTQR
jgi:hypothetical protein